MTRLLPFVLLWALAACQSPIAIDIDLKTAPDSVAVFAPGVLSTSLQERDLAIAPDGQSLIYTLGNHTQTARVLVMLRQKQGVWQAPELLPFSGTHNDIEPFFHPNGQQLYFASDRPIYGDSTRSDYNIWWVERQGPSWGTPQAMDSLINTRADEFYPAITHSGNLYFTATRNNGIGREDIFVSRWQNGIYQAPMPLDSTINTKVFEFNAYVSPEEDLIVFSAYGRPDGLGGGDLYYSQKDAEGNWQPSVHLGPEINSPKLDFCPFVDWEREVFYFSSNRMKEAFEPISTVEAFIEQVQAIENGQGNIYHLGLKNLPFAPTE